MRKKLSPTNSGSATPSPAMETPGRDKFAPIKEKILERYSRLYNLSEQQGRTLRKKKLFLMTYQHANGKIAPACKAIHICRKTFYNWCRTDPDFRRATEDIPGYGYDFVEDLAMFRIFGKNDGAMMRFWLTHKHPGYKPVRRPPIRRPLFEMPPVRRRGYNSLSELFDEDEEDEESV